MNLELLRRLPLLTALGIGALALNSSRTSAGPHWGSVRVATAPSGLAGWGLRSPRGPLLLFRHQFEVAESASKGSPKTPSRQGSSGRILELVEGDTPDQSVRLWNCAYPFDEALPRDLHCECVVWDFKQEDAWVFTSSSTEKVATIRAYRIGLGARGQVGTGLPMIPKEIHEWPKPLTPTSVFTLEAPDLDNQWPPETIIAVPERAGFTIALTGALAPATRWLRYDTTDQKWSRLTDR